jgi:ArsR family transcriptional regulator
MKKIAEFDSCAERLKAVADADRLRILNCLFAGPKTVGEIAEALGEELVKVSHHLGILRRSKILLASKQGRFVQYSVHPDVKPERLAADGSRKINFGCCKLEIES